MKQKLRCYTAVAAILASAAPLARADAQALDRIDLPAQSLAESIRAIARHGSINVLVDPNLVRGQWAPPLKAHASAAEALNQILYGTGLTPCFVDDRTIAIVAATVGSPASACEALETHAAPRVMGVSHLVDDRPRIRLAQLDTDAAPPVQNKGQQTQTLEEVVVTALNFRYEEATTALKLPLSVKDTPQSIKAVTEDVIEFSGIRKFEDVYKIDASGGTSHALDDFARNYYRGFRQESDNAIKVDGFRLTGAMNLDLAPFERFEIVKGATSTLYGQNSIAGTLNAISKMPRSSFGGEFRAELGSFDHYRADVDVYGPVTDDGSLAYRVIGAYTDDQSFLDLANRNVALFAPTLRYEFSPDTTVTARIIYQENDSRHHFGYGLQITDAGLRIPDVPRSTYGGMKWNSVKRDALFALTSIDHRFANGWKLRGSVQYNSVDGTLTEFIPAGLDPDGTALIDAAYARNDEDDVYSGEVTLFGDVEMFGRNHTLFLGMDYSSQKFAHVSATDYLFYGFNIFDPNPELIPPRHSLTDYPEFFNQRQRNEEAGVTAQAVLRPSDALTVILGARYTRNDTDLRTRVGEMALLNDLAVVPFGAAETIDSDEVTVQAGVTYAVTDDINVYASYGETFEPQFGFVAGGGQIDPERGTAYEIGLKGDFAERLSYSLALFDMERTNIAQDDFTNPGFVVALGTQRSRGVELDFQGEIVSGWDVYGSFAVLDAEFSEGQFKGMQPVNAPRFGASLFTSYEFQEGALRGLGIGGGVVHKHGRKTFDDDRFGIFGSTPEFDFGDFTEVDLRVFYTVDRWRLQVSGTNVTNEKYYSPTFNTFAYAIQVNPAPAVVASISYAF